MKRFLAIIALIFALSTVAHAQSVTVTGHLVSGNTNPVTAKAFMRFRLRNFSGNTPRVTSTGDIVQTQFDVAPDNTGLVTTTIYANDFIAPVNTFWTVETWFNGIFVSSYNYGICAVTQVTYCSTHGSTFNLDSAMPISFPTPPAPYLPLPGPTGPTGPAGPIGPQGPPGAGGSGPTLQTNGGTNASQSLLNQIAGTNVTLVNSGGNVTVNAVPTAPLNCLQYDNAGAFGGASGICTPDGNNLILKGPEPFSDIMAFGARAVSSPLALATTASFNSGSPNVTIAVANFVNGDGVTIQGAGATNVMSTPTAPTVAPKYASGGTRSHLVVASPTGSSTYIYAVVAEDKGQGLSAPSLTTTIATGQSSLGLQSVGITSVSRSNDTMTVNLASSTTLTTGQLVDIVLPAGVGNTFAGEVRVATSAGTSFTVTNTAFDSRATGWSVADSQTSLTASGTLYYYQANGLTWPMVTGARRFWICAQRPGDGSLHVVGQSDMSDSVSGWQGTAWEDWGSTYEGNQTFPYYVTDAICTGSATNDSLTTTVSSGGGTTSLVLATNALQTDISNTKKINIDAVPAIHAAEAQSNGNHGCVFIPAPSTSASNIGFPINSFLKFSSVGHGGCVIDAGLLQVNDTIELSQTYWTGNLTNQSTPAFGWNGGGEIQTFAANPTLHLVNSGNYLDWLYMIGANNAETLVLSDATSSIIDRSNFISDSSANTDYLGMDIMYRNTSGTIASHKLQRSQINGGPDQVTDKSWTPLISIPGGQNGSGGFQNSGVQLEIDHAYANRRGIEQDSGFGTVIHHWYTQGPIFPTLIYVPQAGGIAQFVLDDIIQDTSGEPVFSSISSGAQALIEMTNSSGSSQGNPILSGARPVDIHFLGVPSFNASAPANRWSNSCGPAAMVTAPYETGIGSPVYVSQQLCTNGSPLDMLAGYPIFWPLAAPNTITASATAGGSMPAGTFEYSVSATGFDGGETIPQTIPSSNVTTSGTCPGSGNCSVTVGWTALTGALSYNVFRCNTSGTCTTNGVINLGAGNWLRVATHVTGTSTVDTLSAPTNNLAPFVTATGISGMNNNSAWAPLFAVPETTAPSGVAGFGLLYEDSTTHLLVFNANNIGAQTIPRYTISPSANDCVFWSGTTGLLGDAGGKCAHYTITPTNGDCVTWSGVGGLLGDAGAACGAGAGGMDTNMDNMANPTLMNHSLVPAAANTIAVGTAPLPFTNVFIGTVANQAGSFDTSALTGNFNIKFPNGANSTAVLNCAASTHNFMTQILQSTGACTIAQPSLADISAGASAAGLYNFSASTMEIPASAGFTAGAASTLGLDTTAKALHSYINTADAIVASFASAPAGSKCAQTSGAIGQLTEAANACGTTTPSSSDTFTNKVYNAEGTGNTLSEPVRAFFQAGGCNNTTAGNGFDIGVANGPTPQCTGSTVRKGVLQFARGNVAYINFHLPNDWASGASTDINLCVTTTDTTNAHVISFNVQTGFNSVTGVATDDPALNASQALSITIGASQTSGGEICGSLTGMTMTGSNPNYNFEIVLTRNNSGVDTSTDPAVAVKSAELIYGVSKNSSNR